MALSRIETDGLKDSAVTAAKIDDDSITNADIKSDAAIVTTKLSGALTSVANHGLGSAAALTAGTAAGNLVVLDGSGNLPAVGGAALTGVATDLSSIRQDILTLALHSAVADNKAAHNLPTAFIDQFEDDTGLLTQTTVDRDSSGEYVATNQAAGTTGAFTSDSNTLLLLHMDGSNDSTTFTDSSSHNRTVTRTSTTAPQPDLDTGTKKFGTASTYFGSPNGSTGHHGNSLYIDDHADWNFEANPFTMECWVYMNAFTNGSNSSVEFGGQAISNTADVGGSWHWQIRNSSGQLQFNTYQRNGSNTNDDIQIQSSSNLSLNTWTHVAVTRDVNTVRMYLGGVQVGTVAVPNNNSYKLTANDLGGRWYISRRAYSTGYGYVSGYIDEYRISNNCRYPSGTTFIPNEIPGTVDATGTLISNAQTAPSATTSLSGVFLYTDSAGTATIGTDLKIYMSADNGSNFTEAASYSTAQTFSGSVKMVRLGKTTVTSGTQVKLKAVWANQATAKVTRLNGWAINY